MDSISEARRHLANAKEILSEKARKEDGYYQDKKYVKMAGHTAYTGVLLALDSLLGNKKKSSRKSVEWYQVELSTMDRKITKSFAGVYEILHLAMGYEGAGNTKVAAIGLKEAENIINWTEIRTQNFKN